jgi:hypothetical protein
MGWDYGGIPGGTIASGYPSPAPRRRPVRQYEKRLGRPLTDEERTTLMQRLATLGGDRLDDVLLGLSPEAIAAWLRRADAA